MGSIEREVSARVRRSKVQRAVLGAVIAAGVLSVALVAPNALQLLRVFDRGRKRKSDPKHSVNRAFWRLVDSDYLVLEETSHGAVARLTPKGERALPVLDRPDAKLKKPKRWDKKWRVLIFDIREKRRSVRDRLRLTLEQIGFLCLQRSVWVYPYDCEDLIILLKADFRIGKDVLYMVVDRIEQDERLKRRFSLL